MNQNSEIENNSVHIKLNEEMYSKEVLFHASYVLLEQYYFYFDKKNGYFEIQITPKTPIENQQQLKEIENKFLQELVESAAYLKQLEKTSGIRQLLLERALLTQTKEKVDFEALKKEIDKN